MVAQATENQSCDQYSNDCKAMYLHTRGGRIICLRCTAKSLPKKQLCGRPAITTSRMQKCQFYEDARRSAVAYSEHLNKCSNEGTFNST